MLKKSFKTFDFRGFVDFIYELVDKYGMYGILFYPDNRAFFSDIQLNHVAPQRNINNSNGFVWAWMKKQNEVRKVSFDLFAQTGKPRITMTIDLDKKLISLDKVDGISVVQLEEAMTNNLNGISNDLIKKNNQNKWWETTWFQLIALIAALLGIIGFFLFLKK